MSDPLLLLGRQMSLTVTVAVVRAAAPHIVCYLPAYRGMVPLLHLPEDVLETYRHLDFPNRMEVRALPLPQHSDR